MEPLSGRLQRRGHDDEQRLYPLSAAKPNARYIGEIYADQADVVRRRRRSSRDQDIRFKRHHETKNPFFTESECRVHVSLRLHLESGAATPSSTSTTTTACASASAVASPTRPGSRSCPTVEAVAVEHHIGPIVAVGVDHMATRILAGEREDAILEFLTMSKYYFWGAYNINDMNSSTNVNRNGQRRRRQGNRRQRCSRPTTRRPMSTHSKRLPMPTEDFVRNFGRRMHHMAYQVVDGEHADAARRMSTTSSACCATNGVPSSPTSSASALDTPDLKQIFSKHSQGTRS